MSRSRRIPVVRIASPEGRALLSRIRQGRNSRDKTVERLVKGVVEDVAKRGDAALFEYTRRFDHRALTSKTVRIRAAQIASQAVKTPKELQTTIREASRRIRAFHERQMPAGFSMKTREATLAQRIMPLDRVGVYVPGGYTAYPSSVLMNIIPAQIAGVREIAVVTPVKESLNPAVAFALRLLRVSEVYRVGGCQAVAALAYGTASIRRVDKIVGPGNAYVACAKRLVYGEVDIDAVAGPSEVAILADRTANAGWVAIDMLAQAEHGSGDETAVCVTEDSAFGSAVARSLTREIELSAARPVFGRLPAHALAVFVARDRRESIEFVNSLAPEHVQVMTFAAARDVQKITNAGAVFVGGYTPVALGDYFVGTNHVLPTGGTARFASGLSVESFVRRMSVAQVNSAGLELCRDHVSRFARAEGFVHHALSVEIRSPHRASARKT